MHHALTYPEKSLIHLICRILCFPEFGNLVFKVLHKADDIGQEQPDILSQVIRSITNVHFFGHIARELSASYILNKVVLLQMFFRTIL